MIAIAVPMQLNVTSLKWLHDENGYIITGQSLSVVSEPVQSVRWMWMGPLPNPAYMSVDGLIIVPVTKIINTEKMKRVVMQLVLNIASTIHLRSVPNTV